MISAWRFVTTFGVISLLADVVYEAVVVIQLGALGALPAVLRRA